MTTLLLVPWRSVPFAISLMQLLLSVEPGVAAFAFAPYTHHGVVSSPALIIQPKTIHSTTRLYAANSKSKRDENNEEQKTVDVSSSNGNSKKQSIGDYLPSSSSTERRRRKLVDRSNIYSVDTSRTTNKSLFVENNEEELCFLDDLPGTDVGQSCFVSSDNYDNGDDANPSAS
eukprot:scaffold26971_cov90-Skeletonema_dohrnii-CCMP3373.AAC.1